MVMAAMMIRLVMTIIINNDNDDGASNGSSLMRLQMTLSGRRELNFGKTQKVLKTKDRAQIFLKILRNLQLLIYEESIVTPSLRTTYKI